MITQANELTLNTICAYNTMFPLDFPLGILRRQGQKDQWVMDPFCGRGTTNYAARLQGLNTIGIDSSPVASAIANSKLANVQPQDIVKVALEILDEVLIPNEIPNGEFWEWAYHPQVLDIICRIREGLLRHCDSDARKALSAIMMGALHGHLTKTKESHFSNQCQRTYSPKPAYAVRFWKKRGMRPPRVDVLAIIKERAARYYTKIPLSIEGEVYCGDSRIVSTFQQIKSDYSMCFDWIITSPPYYGMRSYLPDQWLRLWFVGGSASVDYSQNGQIPHKGIDLFIDELRKVWINLLPVCKSNTRMVVRFGGLPSVKSDPLDIMRQSFQNTEWEIYHRRSAGFSTQGQRQAYQQAKNRNPPVEEYDFWVRART